MNKLSYECCPRCKRELIFRTLSKFDLDGIKLGYVLTCKSCGWFDWNRFYPKEEVEQIVKEK